jgi:transcriptional regulator with XRE-family HTH domain
MNHERLRSWRDSLSFSDSEAAELLGVSLDTYRQWELGFSEIPDGVLKACSAINKRWQGKNPLHRAIFKSIKEYKEAYRYYFKAEPEGRHLIPTPWTALKYDVFDLSPAKTSDNRDLGMRP